MKFVSFTMNDGYEISARYWQNTSEDGVLYIHGIQSHGLWFETSASLLADAGFSVFLPDRRGSGLNKQLRGDVSHFSRWIYDLQELIAQMRSKYGMKRIHILAVSWGGKLALSLAGLLPEQISSMSLVAPGIFPKVDVALSDKIAVAGALLSNPKKKFPIPLDDPKLFTDNPQRQKFIMCDALKLTDVSARFLYQSRKLDAFIRRRIFHLQFPMKLFLAGRDRIIDNCETIKFYRGIRTMRAKTLVFYPSAAHTLEFEDDNTKFLNDLRDWMLLCTNV